MDGIIIIILCLRALWFIAVFFNIYYFFFFLRPIRLIITQHYYNAYNYNIIIVQLVFARCRIIVVISVTTRVGSEMKNMPVKRSPLLKNTIAIMFIITMSARLLSFHND